MLKKNGMICPWSMLSPEEEDPERLPRSMYAFHSFPSPDSVLSDLWNVFLVKNKSCFFFKLIY